MKTFSKDYIIPNRLFKIAGYCYVFDRIQFMEAKLGSLSEDEKIVVFLTLAELVGDVDLYRFKYHLFEKVKVNCYDLFNYEPEHYNTLLKKFEEFKILNLKIPENYKISLVNLKLQFQELNLILDIREIYILYMGGIRFKIFNYETMGKQLPRIRTRFDFYHGDYEFLSLAYIETGTGRIKLEVMDSEIKSDGFKTLMESFFSKLLIK